LLEFDKEEMLERRKSVKSSKQEVNLKSFFGKVLKNKYLFLSSIGLALALALAYIYLATPQYEVSSSLLIDSSGENRVLGESDYVDGGISLIEMEKNLYNEIGIIESFSLVRQTVEDLGFDVSYHAGNLLKKRECYGYFPFEVSLEKNKAQLYGVPFEIEQISNEKYRLTIEGSDFWVSNPSTDSKREIKRDFNFSEEYAFGDTVNHAFFNFVIKKPEYEVSLIEFEGDDLSFKVYDLDDIANSYTDKTEVNNIDIQASIFRISSTGSSVKKEIDFIERLTENYIHGNLKSRNDIASTKEEFIRSQLADISDSLSKAELKLELFKKDKRAVNLGATATNALGQTQDLQVEKGKIQLDIKYYKSLIQNVQSNRNSDDFSIPTALGIDDPLINANIIELTDLYALRSKKKFFVTDNNQEMAIINRQIKESTDLLVNNLQNAIQSAQFSLGRVNSQLSNFNGLISSLPTRENQLLSIERQSKLYENLFNYLSQELAKTGIARAESTSDTRVLDNARMSGTGPIAPQKPLILLLAGVLGMLLPLVKIVFFSDNDIIENMAQIEDNTDIPVIASITRHDTKARKSDAALSLWKTKESFRDLYANLELIGPDDKDCCVIGMTSIMPEEGKTYCSINLGISLAEAGKKTLIIDGDLRNPSLVSENFDKITGKGLSNYLKGDLTSSDDIIYPHNSVRNLEFIPTVVIDSNVHGLLSGPKLKSLMNKLEKKYDYIILDTPAVGLVSDFLLYSEYIDINLFVARRGIAKLAFLKDFENLILRGSKKKKNYIIFNDTLEKDYKYGYGQKYGDNKEEQIINDSLAV